VKIPAFLPEEPNRQMLMIRKRPGKAIFRGHYLGGMIASQLMKEAINKANHLDRRSAKAAILGEIFSPDAYDKSD
jgi:hypothetical protein